MNFVSSEESQDTDFPNLTLKFIHTCSLYISPYTFYLFIGHNTDAATRKFV